VTALPRPRSNCTVNCKNKQAQGFLSFSVRQAVETVRFSCCSELFVIKLEVQDRFPALPDFMISTGSGKGSTQPRECN
jgi:hypothetical protein